MPSSTGAVSSVSHSSQRTSHRVNKSLILTLPLYPRRTEGRESCQSRWRLQGRCLPQPFLWRLPSRSDVCAAREKLALRRFRALATAPALQAWLVTFQGAFHEISAATDTCRVASSFACLLSKDCEKKVKGWSPIPAATCIAQVPGLLRALPPAWSAYNEVDSVHSLALFDESLPALSQTLNICPVVHSIVL